MSLDASSDDGGPTRSLCGATVASVHEALDLAREAIERSKAAGYRFVALSMTSSTKAGVIETGVLAPLLADGCRLGMSWVDHTRTERGDPNGEIIVVTWGADPFKPDPPDPSAKAKPKAKPKTKSKPKKVAASG